MSNIETKLQVRDLTVSFRTTNGKVQAVRGINFELKKGETLAIVGESGSGKSVTSKAIMGILANNSIVEGGEIIYDGKDILKLREEEMHKLRGDKVAMIFQDPMSSLNPIVKIGRQLTEAMILKGKARQRESRITFNAYLKALTDSMVAAGAGAEADIRKKSKNFNKFEVKHLELEGAYRTAYAAAEEAAGDIGALVFELEKNAGKDVNYRVKRIEKLCKEAVQDYVVKEKAAELQQLAAQLKGALSESKKKDGSSKHLQEVLSGIGEIMQDALKKTEPNFFSMGYYLTFSGKQLPQMPVAELNDYLRKYLDDNFMLNYIADAKQGLMYSAEKAYEKKEAAIAVLRAHRKDFEHDALNEKACKATHKIMVKAVEDGIDRLEFIKDSRAYTFSTALEATINDYFSAIKKNAKEEIRFQKQSEKRARLVARGKEPEWQLVPKSLISLEEAQQAILHQVDNIIEHYENLIANKDSRNFDNETVAAVDYLKANASGVAAKVTKGMAKERAIKLMEEVGIAEARKRYNQYPFEFSGGMRQRIVIAIALAANPDILICDEPTTALDVTIQSQILELINNLKETRKLSVIFITHDLGVVANMADRIAVMYAGKIVEYGTSEDIFYRSAHPYTWALLSSMPDLDTDERLDAIPGTPPNMIYPPVGDAFAPRNKYAMQIDFEQQPPMFEITETHHAATWLLHPNAPKVDPPKVILDRIARMNAKRGANDAE